MLKAKQAKIGVWVFSPVGRLSSTLVEYLKWVLSPLENQKMHGGKEQIGRPLAFSGMRRQRE